MCFACVVGMINNSISLYLYVFYIQLPFIDVIMKKIYYHYYLYPFLRFYPLVVMWWIAFESSSDTDSMLLWRQIKENSTCKLCSTNYLIIDNYELYFYRNTKRHPFHWDRQLISKLIKLILQCNSFQTYFLPHIFSITCNVIELKLLQFDIHS